MRRVSKKSARVQGMYLLPSIQNCHQHQRHGNRRLELFFADPLGGVRTKTCALARKVSRRFCFRARASVSGVSVLASMQVGRLRLELFFAAALGGAVAGTPHLG